jgi:WD40 repeat protein
MKRCSLLFVASTVLSVCAGSAAAQDRPDVFPRKDLRGHRGAVEHVAFHPNGKLLISAGSEGRIKLWNLETTRLVREIFPRSKTVDAETGVRPRRRRIEWLAFTPDGKAIGEAAVEGSFDTTLRLWNPEDGEQLRLLAENESNLRCLAFTPDGKLVASNARDPEKWGQKIVLRDPENGKVVAELRADRLAATLLAFSPDGKTLASAGARKIQIWDVATREVKHTISGHKKAIQSICFSPNGRYLVSGSTDDTIRVWNVEPGTLDREIEAKQDGVLAVAYSPSGKTIASGGADKTIKLWKPWSGTMRVRLWGHLDKVLCLAFSPDGKTLASGSRDSTILLWDIDEPKDEEQEEEETDQDKPEKPPRKRPAPFP